MYRTTVVKYDGILELLEACQKAWDAGRQSRTILGGDHYNENWVGGKFRNIQDVIDKYNNPWQEGLDVVQWMIYEINREGESIPPPKDRKRRPHYNAEDGDELDFDRLMSGQQEFWRSTMRQSVRAPQFVSIMTAVTANGSIRPAEILWRGAVAVCLSDILENAGYRVALSIVEACSGPYGDHTEKHLIHVPIKHEQDPVDVASLINAVSGWFFRTIVGFQAFHVPTNRTPTPGYGGYFQISERMPEIQELAGTGSKPIVIDGVWNREAAVTKVKTVLHALNNEGELVREDQ